MSINGYRSSDRLCFGGICTGKYYDFLEVASQSGLGSSENYFGVLGLALGGPKDNVQGDSDGMGMSFLDEAVTNGGLKEENAKFTFIFNKEKSDFILGNNDDFVKGLSFAKIQLARDSLYWRQNTTKNTKLGVTGIKVKDQYLKIPKAVNTENYAYSFDTAYQMISIPQGNTWDSTAADYYLFDRIIQNILAGKKYKNVCMKENSYYYNNGNSCYTVPCKPEGFDSVFFQIDTDTMFEVRPEDYILQELTVDLVDDYGQATGDTYCRLAFSQTYETTFRFGIMAMQGYTMEFDTTKQTVKVAPSKDSTKSSIESNTKVFDTDMIKVVIPVPDNCILYGYDCPIISPDVGVWSKLTIAKAVSCGGGLLVWFILIFWAVPCLPEFKERA